MEDTDTGSVGPCPMHTPMLAMQMGSIRKSSDCLGLSFILYLGPLKACLHIQIWNERMFYQKVVEKRKTLIDSKN